MSTEKSPAEIHFDKVLEKQRAKGRAKYGKPLDYNDGRDWNEEALQEALDLGQYLAAENLLLAKENDRLNEDLKQARARRRKLEEELERVAEERDQAREALAGAYNVAKKKVLQGVVRDLERCADVLTQSRPIPAWAVEESRRLLDGKTFDNVRASQVRALVRVFRGRLGA